jgi:hypothetical protein
MVRDQLVTDSSLAVNRTLLGNPRFTREQPLPRVGMAFMASFRLIADPLPAIAIETHPAVNRTDAHARMELIEIDFCSVF